MENTSPVTLEINQRQVDHNITAINEASKLIGQADGKKNIPLIYDEKTGNLTRDDRSNHFLKVNSAFEVGKNRGLESMQLTGVTSVTFDAKKDEVLTLTSARITVLYSLLTTAYGADWRDNENIDKLIVKLGEKEVSKDELKKAFDSVIFECSK